MAASSAATAAAVAAATATATDADADADAAQYRLLVPDDVPPEATTTTTTTSDRQRPLVICFHGSGESCSPSWDALAGALRREHGLRVLLCDRGPLRPRPEEATADLRAHLQREGLWPGPYVLVAHSYGGAFARTFLHRHGRRGGAGGADVAGVVLVETGQEGGLDPKVEQAQYRRRVLGSRPLSVVRGNSLLAKWRELEEAEAGAEAETGAGTGTGAGTSATPAEKRGKAVDEEGLRIQREMLQRCGEEDERLKKRQLDLSRNARYVHIPDCGHHVVRDRPDAVAAEVCWVLENMESGRQRKNGEGEGLWARTAGKLRSMLRT